MKNSHILNQYQLQTLERGAEMEQGGVHIHTHPRNETEQLLTTYYRWVYDGEHCDIEIVVGALRSLFDFWACYFACGADTAFAIKAEYDRIFMAELEAKIQKWQLDADMRLEAEVERYGT